MNKILKRREIEYKRIKNVKQRQKFFIELGRVNKRTINVSFKELDRTACHTNKACKVMKSISEDIGEVVDRLNVDLRFIDLINNKITSDIEQFCILDGDDRILVDISDLEGNKKIEKFVSELNKYSCKEYIRKSNKMIRNLVNSADNLLEKDETIVD